MVDGVARRKDRNTRLLESFRRLEREGAFMCWICACGKMSFNIGRESFKGCVEKTGRICIPYRLMRGGVQLTMIEKSGRMCIPYRLVREGVQLTMIEKSGRMCIPYRLCGEAFNSCCCGGPGNVRPNECLLLRMRPKVLRRNG